MNAFKHCFVIVTRVPTFMATQFCYLPFFRSSRILEYPSSITGSPLSTPSCKHAFPQCIQFYVLLMSTLVPKHFELVKVFMILCSWIFLQGSQSSLTIRGCSSLCPLGLCFLNHTLLGYHWHTTTTLNHMHIIKIIKYLRRDSYPIPSCHMPYWYEKYL